jgi:hypothetical protein
MENRSQKLFNSLKIYYTPDKIEQILNVINQTTNKVSLRLIDWLVTNYSRSHNVSYKLRSGSMFNLHQSYKNMLKAYSKKLFDPFKRHNRVYIELKKPIQDVYIIETTVAQLTFLKWAIDYEVIEYANKYKDKIKLHMNITVKSTNDTKQPKPKKDLKVYNVKINMKSMCGN